MNIPVNYNGSFSYHISINNDFSALHAMLDSLSVRHKKACIVTDSHVAKLHLEALCTMLDSRYDLLITHIIPAGEEHKNLEEISRLYVDLIEAHFDRSDLLIALGGGVVGDMTGFCAATYLRGIDFIQIPTTLLAMVDSSVGGKTGVDCMQYKNMVGAFYMPRLVYMNLALLDTLPAEQFACGMGEVIKTACIQDADLLAYLKAHPDGIQGRSYENLSHVVATCCDIKRRVVEEDPTEKGIRAILNFGHTIGHAIEKLSGFRLYHGQCVSLGIVSALYISEQTGRISQADMDSVIDLLLTYHLPVHYDPAIADLDREAIYEATRSDKKMAGGKIKFILLDKLGEAVIDTGLTQDLIKESIDYVIKEN